MYMYVTTPEPGNPRYPREGMAKAMAAKLQGAAPAIQALATQITNDDEVVYKPLYTLFVEGHWHKGRVLLIGDAAEAGLEGYGERALARSTAMQTSIAENYVGPPL